MPRIDFSKVVDPEHGEWHAADKSKLRPRHDPSPVKTFQCVDCLLPHAKTGHSQKRCETCRKANVIAKCKAIRAAKKAAKVAIKRGEA